MQQKQVVSRIWRKIDPQGKFPSDRAAHSCDLISGNLYVFGGWNGINALCDIFCYSFEINNWTEVHPIGDFPSQRNNHTTAVSQTKLYVHGGHNGNTWLDDLYYLETQGEHAMWVKVQIGGKQIPTARACHSLNRVGKKLYMFGGYDGQECFNQMEVFDIQLQQWNQPAVKGKIPTARNAHTMTQQHFDQKLFLFGGHSGAQHLQDLYMFDCLSLEWQEICTKGILPKGLRGHSASLLQNRIYIFGGYDGTGRSNDLFIFNIALQKWQVPNQHYLREGCDDDTLVLSQIPQPRQRHSATATDQEMIYIFGGFDGNKWLNDLYVLDIGLLETSSINEESKYRVIKNVKTNLFNNKDFSDITFVVQGKQIYGHRTYLACQSDHFRALFLSGMKDSREKVFTVSNCSYNSFFTFLEFLYTGEINLLEQCQEIKGLADEYVAEDLKSILQKQLKKLVTNESVCDLLIYSQKYSASYLKSTCMKHLLKNISLISGSTNYEKLQQQPNLLVEITRSLLSANSFE